MNNKKQSFIKQLDYEPVKGPSALDKIKEKINSKLAKITSIAPTEKEEKPKQVEEEEKK